VDAISTSTSGMSCVEGPGWPGYCQDAYVFVIWELWFMICGL
jgi:hypothetical protein